MRRHEFERKETHWCGDAIGGGQIAKKLSAFRRFINAPRFDVFGASGAALIAPLTAPIWATPSAASTPALAYFPSWYSLYAL